MPEVANDGAVIVDPTNVAEINFAIKRVINDEIYRNELIKNGYINAKRFSLEVISKEYCNLYQSISSDYI